MRPTLNHTIRALIAAEHAPANDGLQPDLRLAREIVAAVEPYIAALDEDGYVPNHAAHLNQLVEALHLAARGRPRSTLRTFTEQTAEQARATRDILDDLGRG